MHFRGHDSPSPEDSPSRVSPAPTPNISPDPQDQIPVCFDDVSQPSPPQINNVEEPLGYDNDQSGSSQHIKTSKCSQQTEEPVALSAAERRLNINLTPVRDKKVEELKFPQPTYQRKQFQGGYRYHMDLSSPRNTFQQASLSHRTPRMGAFRGNSARAREKTRIGSAIARSSHLSRNGVVLGKTCQNGLSVQPQSLAKFASILRHATINHDDLSPAIPKSQMTFGSYARSTISSKMHHPY